MVFIYLSGFTCRRFFFFFFSFFFFFFFPSSALKKASVWPSFFFYLTWTEGFFTLHLGIKRVSLGVNAPKIKWRRGKKKKKNSFLPHTNSTSLFKILESALIAATCVITQATKQMQGNDSGVGITAETWREIWQSALRICLSSSARLQESLSAAWDDRRHLQPQREAPDTERHAAAPIRRWSGSGVGCDVEPPLSGFL